MNILLLLHHETAKQVAHMAVIVCEIGKMPHSLTVTTCSNSKFYVIAIYYSVTGTSFGWQNVGVAGGSICTTE